MARGSVRVWGWLGVLLAAGCESAGPTAEPPAEPGPCYEVSPGVYTLLAENSSFRVIEARWAAGQKDQWHEHPPLAAFFVTDVNGKLHYPDGSSKDVRGKAGEVKLTAEPETHYFENLADAECRVVLFERVHAGMVPTPGPNDRPPCADASPEVYRVLAENDALRVILATWEAGKQDEWHSHPPLAAYALTPVNGRLRYQTADDKVVQGDAGMVTLLAAPESHSFQNAGAECRMVLVELR